MLIIPYILCTAYILFWKKNDKRVWLYAASLMAMLSITTKEYADLDNYVPLFDYLGANTVSTGIMTTKIGWVLLNKLFYDLGFNYRGLVIVMIFVNYYIMHISLKNLKVREDYFFGLFLIFPSIIQLIQLKFFIGCSLIFWGFSLLASSQRFSKLKFILLVFMAMSIHTASAIFLLFLLIDLPKIERKQITILTIFITGIFGLNLDFFASFASNYLTDKEASHYLYNTAGRSSVLWIASIVLIWVISYIIAWYLYPIVKYKVNNIHLDEQGIKSIDHCYKGIVILMITLPLLLLNRHFHRFIEMGYYFLYVLVGYFIQTKRRYYFNEFCSLIIMVVLLLMVNMVYSPYETTILPLFTYEGIVNIWR